MFIPLNTSMRRLPILLFSTGLISLYSPSVLSNRYPAYNQPNEYGNTTLVEKCIEIVRAQRANDFGRVMALSFQVGFEHDSPWSDDVDETCASVGINTHSELHFRVSLCLCFIP